jgi:cytoskeleton protein RodZ
MSEVMEQGAAPVAPERPVRLREAREAAGLHIAALAAALKVPVRKLEALEAGRYGELPDLTFARALASSACRHLKVDPAPVLEQIPLNPVPALAERDSALNAPFKPATESPAASPLSWLSRPAMLGAIALLLATLVIVFLPRQASAPASEPAAVVITPAPVAPGAPLFQPGAPAESAGEGAPGAPATPGSEAVTTAPAAAPAPMPATETPVPAAPAPVPAAAATPVAAADAGAPPASGAVLSLLATQESWVEVVNGTGTVVLQRLLQAGERVEFSAAPPYGVVLGNAGVVQVSVRGRPFNATAIARNNVARFEAR